VRLLLDTHIWLWLNLEPARLPAHCAAAMANADHELVVSVASVWELSIKEKLGKLGVGGPFLPFLERALEGIRLLDIRRSHVERGHDLPPIHRDPFDRIIVAQALAEEFTLLTVDHSLEAYGVKLLRP
jgi:PIN domain nuclease of toxin-antitoxin system